MVYRALNLSRFHPAGVLLMAIGLVLVLQGFAALLTLATASVAWGVPIEDLQRLVAADDAGQQTWLLLLWINAAAQVVSFGGAAVLLAAGYANPRQVLGWAPPAPVWGVGVAALWVIVAQPFLGFFALDADSFALPESLSAFERAAEAAEAAVAQQIERILQAPLWLSLLSLALLPAVFEELIFRGLVLSLLRRWLGLHAAVWVQGVLFGLVHFQVYGLVPRVFLGVAFGYFRVTTGSLVPAIVAHLVNNASTVGLYLALTQPEDDPTTQLPFPFVLASGVLAVGLIAYLYRRRVPAVRLAPDPVAPSLPPLAVLPPETQEEPPRG